MRDYYDRIVFWACFILLAIMAFLGGLLSAFGIVLWIWRVFI